MNIERMNLRRKLVAFLHDTCPELVRAMKHASHMYPGTDSSTNSFHLEDSVWTHTLLALQAALECEDFTLTNILTALVHDFAKPRAATIKPGKSGQGKRVSFAGHGPLGTQAAVDFLCALRAGGVLHVDDREIVCAAFATSLHISFYDLDNAQDALAFCNGDRELLCTLARLLYCDIQGSVGDTGNANFFRNFRLLQAIDALFEQETGEAPEKGSATCRQSLCGTNAPDSMSSARIHLVCGPATRSKAALVEELSQGLPRVAVGTRDDFLPCSRFLSWDCVKSASGCDVRRLAATGGPLGSLVRLLADGAAGVVLVGELLTRKERKAICGLVRLLFPREEIFCTYVLSQSTSWPDGPAGASALAGLPEPVREQVLPCLLLEPNLAGAHIVFCPNREDVRKDQSQPN